MHICVLAIRIRKLQIGIRPDDNQEVKQADYLFLLYIHGVHIPSAICVGLVGLELFCMLINLHCNPATVAEGNQSLCK